MFMDCQEHLQKEQNLSLSLCALGDGCTRSCRFNQGMKIVRGKDGQKPKTGLVSLHCLVSHVIIGYRIILNLGSSKHGGGGGGACMCVCGGFSRTFTEMLFFKG